MCPSVGEQIHTTWSIYMLDYYLAMKRSEALTLVTTWTDPEHTMLS